MTSHELVAPPLIRHTEKIEALLSAKSKFAPVMAAIDFPLELADAHPSYRASWLLRHFSETVEGAESILFEAKEILFSGSSPFAELVGDEIGRFGRSAIALYGPDPKRTALLLSKFALAEAASGPGKSETGSEYRIGLKPLATPPSPLHVDLEIRLPEDRLDNLRVAFEAFGSIQKTAFHDQARSVWMGFHCVRCFEKQEDPGSARACETPMPWPFSPSRRGKKPVCHPSSSLSKSAADRGPF